MTGPYTRMEAEILRQGELLETGVEPLISAARASLAPRPSRLILTGCGDSLCSAAAVADSLSRRTGLPVEAVSPLLILRDGALLREGDLLIGLSVSGKTARVVEAVRRARAMGRRVLALTSGTDAPLAREAAHTLLLPYTPQEEALPGTLSFAAGMLALLAVGEALSRDRSGEEALAICCRRSAGRLPGIIASSRDLGRATAPDSDLHFLALDDLLPIAGYGTMKLLECCARHAPACDPEEWCHGPFFSAGPATRLVCMISALDDARYFARAVAAAGRVGASAIGVVDCTDTAATAGLSRDRVVVVDGGGPLAPVLFAAPLQLLALEKARRLGTVPFGFADEQRRRANHGAIYGQS